MAMGIDARHDEQSRTDVIMLIHVKPLNQRIQLISIPRDTKVWLPDVGCTKINHAHFLGELEGNDDPLHREIMVGRSIKGCS